MTESIYPTSSSTLYSAPFNIQAGSTVTVKAKAFKTDWTDSEIAQQIYTVP
jgi:hypothetical protein